MTLGILGNSASSKKMARPLSYGRGFGLGHLGLGASTIPGNCWDATGFKDCHAQAYAQAQSECAGGLAKENYAGDMDTCIERNADAYAWAGCVGKYCPQDTTPKASGATSISWRNTTYNATVAKLQKALNPYLTKLGANTMKADGILGSGTCGAAYWIDDREGTSFYTDYGLASICKTLTMPTKKGTKTPVTTITVVPQTTIIPGQPAITEKADLPWGNYNADTAAVQKRLNVQLDAADMNALSVNGKLDAATCGAMKWAKETQGIDILSIQGQNCQGFTAPTKKTKSSVGPTQPLSPAVGPLVPASGSGKMSQASMATTGLLVGAAAVGVYFLGKHYHWFG
jgi:hypothetical protein